MIYQNEVQKRLFRLRKIFKLTEKLILNHKKQEEKKQTNKETA